MAKYRKKPVIVEAIRYFDHETSHDAVREFVTAPIDEVGRLENAWKLEIFNTAEAQWLPVPKGSWIIKGIAGEYYPCAPEVFDATYEAVSEESDPYLHYPGGWEGWMRDHGRADDV